MKMKLRGAKNHLLLKQATLFWIDLTWIKLLIKKQTTKI